MNFAKLVGIKEAKKNAKIYMKKATDAINFFEGKNERLLAFGKYLLHRVQ